MCHVTRRVPTGERAGTVLVRTGMRVLASRKTRPVKILQGALYGTGSGPVRDEHGAGCGAKQGPSARDNSPRSPEIVHTDPPDCMDVQRGQRSLIGMSGCSVWLMRRSDAGIVVRLTFRTSARSYDDR